MRLLSGALIRRASPVGITGESISAPTLGPSAQGDSLLVHDIRMMGDAGILCAGILSGGPLNLFVQGRGAAAIFSRGAPVLLDALPAARLHRPAGRGLRVGEPPAADQERFHGRRSHRARLGRGLTGWGSSARASSSSPARIGGRGPPAGPPRPAPQPRRPRRRGPVPGTGEGAAGRRLPGAGGGRRLAGAGRSAPGPARAGAPSGSFPRGPR